jgi:erythromycin esterase-like protein
MLENPHEDMLQLQRDLQHVSLDTLMRRHLFPIYQTREMKSFLLWFKKYSRRHPELKLAGCDDSYRDILPSMMIQEAQLFELPILQKLCEDFMQMQVNGSGDDMKVGLNTYLLLTKIDSIYQTQPRRSAFMEQLIFHAKTAYVFYYKFSRKEAVSRDEIMGDRISYHVSDPKEKLVVWAHNGHIAKYAWLDNELGLMGATVLKNFPMDYISIGMSTANGTYSYIDNRFINGDHVYNDTLHTASFRPVKDSSLNSILAGYNPSNLVLDAGQLPDAIHPIRVQGYRKEGIKYSEYHPVNPARLFDVLIFLRESKATEGLFK